MKKTFIIAILFSLATGRIYADNDADIYERGKNLFFMSNYAESMHALSTITDPVYKRLSLKWRLVGAMETGSLPDNSPLWAEARRDGDRNAKRIANLLLAAKDNRPFNGRTERESLLYARALALNGQYAGSLAFYRRVAGLGLEQNRPLALFMIAQISKTLGATADSESASSKLLKDYSGSVYAIRERLNLAPNTTIALTPFMDPPLSFDTMSYKKAARRLNDIYVKNRDAAALLTLASRTTGEDRGVTLFNAAKILETSDPMTASTLYERATSFLQGTDRDAALYAEAALKTRMGSIAQALALLASIPPESPYYTSRTLSMLAGYYTLEDGDRVQSIIRMASNLNLSPNERAYVMLMKGKWAERNGSIAEAVTSYAGADRLASSDVAFDADYHISLIYLKRGEASRARTYLDKLNSVETQKLSPDRKIALTFVKTVSAYQSGRIDEAASLLKTLPLASVGEKTYLRLAAAVEAKRERFADASDLYEKLADRDVRFAQDALFLSALNAYRALDYPRSAGLFRRLLASYQERDGGWAAYYWLGKSQAFLNDNIGAIGSFSSALACNESLKNATPMRRSPSRNEITYEKALALLKTGLSADTEVGRLKREDPAMASRLLLEAGRFYITKNDSTRANALLNNVTGAEEEQALMSRAALYDKTGNDAGSKTVYKQLLTNKTDNPSIPLAAARRLAVLMSHKELSDYIILPAVGALPVKVKMPLLLAWVNGASANELPTANGLLAGVNVAIIDEIEKIDLQLTKASLLMKERIYDQSIAIYDALLKMSPIPRTVFLAAWRGKSGAYEAMGNYPDAVKAQLTIKDGLPKNDPDIKKALTDALNICLRHNLVEQANLIRAIIRENP